MIFLDRGFVGKVPETNHLFAVGSRCVPKFLIGSAWIEMMVQPGPVGEMDEGLYQEGIV